MNPLRHYLLRLLAVLVLAAMAVPSGAQVLVQCPGDVDGDAIPDPFFPGGGGPNPDYDPNCKCLHLAAGDGFITMADGKVQYIFGFSDMTGMMPEHVLHQGMLAANFPAPTIVVDEGNKFYLSLTNVGMMKRPDLFDPHSVHWHGFPQAASIFDGVPEASVAINMGSTLTYFYNVLDPGTYMYHCHVEATEHMQMGMLGNLYVRPKQNGTPKTYGGKTYTQFVYNDGDGSTGYDVEFPVQIGSFDAEFHDSSGSVQPLPFALMKDDYPMLNGRGYPDTINPNPLPPPVENEGKVSQPMSTRIVATQGQRILLRISNLNVTRFYTLASLGLPMKVVGHNAKLLRGPSPDGVTPGKDLSYETNSVTLGGGEALDVMLDTSSVSAGTYFLYTTNLNCLSNNLEDFGGMMAEIVVN
jgi:FtsP/CotA-like multicopper oxidase with cupredoxin domain